MRLWFFYYFQQQTLNVCLRPFYVTHTLILLRPREVFLPRQVWAHRTNCDDCSLSREQHPIFPLGIASLSSFACGWVEEAEDSDWLWQKARDPGLANRNLTFHWSGGLIPRRYLAHVAPRAWQSAEDEKLLFQRDHWDSGTQNQQAVTI